ncbi:TPA: hypothetical protein KOX39_003450 [Clostridioides difficile]|nr:hypothetical protein [Clostridioides difficile]
MCGKFTVNVGSMFSGKTTELLRQGKRHLLAKDNVLYIKPETDDRYSVNNVVTHTGDYTEALVLPINVLLFDIPEIEDADVILVDEIQFFNEGIAEQLNTLATEGKIIYASGLDLTFQREPFNTTMLAMAYADTVNKFKAVCSKCGEDAYISAFKESFNGSVIELGAEDKYTPLCRDCYQIHLDEQFWDDYDSDILDCGCCACCGCSCYDYLEEDELDG